MTGDRPGLRAAFERLTVWDFWAEAPFARLPAPGRDGLVDNPFRDHREKTPSFNVGHGGKTWKDFSLGGSGGIKAFVAECHPDFSDEELNKHIALKAGIEWREKGAKVFTMAEKREYRLQQKRLEREALDRAMMERKRELQFPTRLAPYEKAPDFVLDRWQAGRNWLGSSTRSMDKVAAKRGWPGDWVRRMVEEDLLSMPELPWSDVSKRVQRGLAFPVVAPLGDWVGYHQLYLHYSSGAKSYIYMPKPFRELGHNTDFQKRLNAWAAERGRGVGESMVPALPLALGNTDQAMGVVIVEGQWDALTLHGALSYGRATPPPVAIFGIRGASGTRCFLEAWGPWLKARRPRVLLFPDNDVAGRAWTEPVEAAGRLPSVTFQDRLVRALGPVEVARVKPEHGKDFNDWYRLKKPDQEQLIPWLLKRLKL